MKILKFVNLDQLQREQDLGGGENRQYKIYDITGENIQKFNLTEPEKTYRTPPFDKSKSYQETIRPYDKLTLQVVDTAQTGALGTGGGPSNFGPVEVPSNGMISFPYAGEFSVIGMSIQELQMKIKDRYLSKFNTAEVSLDRISRKEKRANVIGLVRSAGQFQLAREGINLGDLIALSGGTRKALPLDLTSPLVMRVACM